MQKTKVHLTYDREDKVIRVNGLGLADLEYAGADVGNRDVKDIDAWGELIVRAVNSHEELVDDFLELVQFRINFLHEEADATGDRDEQRVWLIEAERWERQKVLIEVAEGK